MGRAVYLTLCYPGLGLSPGNNFLVIAGSTAAQSAGLPPLTISPITLHHKNNILFFLRVVAGFMQLAY